MHKKVQYYNIRATLKEVSLMLAKAAKPAALNGTKVQDFLKNPHLSITVNRQT